MIELTFGVYRPWLCGFCDDAVSCACCGVFCDGGDSRICQPSFGWRETVVSAPLRFLTRILVQRRKPTTPGQILPRVLIQTRFLLWPFWFSWIFSERSTAIRQLGSQPLSVSPPLLRIRYLQESLLIFWISSTLSGWQPHFQRF